VAEFDELELNHSSPSLHSENQSSGTRWIVFTIALVVAAAALGYFALRRSTPRSTATAISEPAPIAKSDASKLEGEKIALPPLQETDPLVRDLVGKLSSHPKVLAWLATRGLIENFTVVTLNVAEGRTPAAHLQTLAPTGRFRVRSTGAGVFVDPVSYQRYDDYAAAVDGLDATGTARLYLTLKPRIVDAYRALGYPDGDFDQVLAKAIANLRAVPVIERDIPLREAIVSYEFADPKLEELSPAQKQFLRMGPRNINRVRQKLSEISMLLGLPLR
jgi:hypothetical protein